MQRNTTIKLIFKLLVAIAKANDCKYVLLNAKARELKTEVPAHAKRLDKNLGIVCSTSWAVVLLGL